ncbi:MAG: TGS domain-containing protein [Anaerolineales bacterium]
MIEAVTEAKLFILGSLVINQQTTKTPPRQLDYLPEHFSPDEQNTICMLAEMAAEHVKNDYETTVTPALLQNVAQTLLGVDCDARTLMIFFMSQIDPEALEPVANKFDPDMLQAAHNVSIIRLLNPTDSPKQMPIRKVLLRQLVLKVTHDVRVILIKIAGRLVLLRNAENLAESVRQKIAQEVLDVVVSWCDALGLEDWRQELQELSFKYLSPAQYNYILSLMDEHRDVLHAVRDDVIKDIRALLQRHHIEAHVSGRVKTHYAVFRKMEAYELDYDEVWDRVGIRILTNTTFDCYYIQTAIEEELYPERRRYVDYIETPRQPYNYQSLHLTVGGPRGIAVEIQIRTYDMHIKGEFGVAAHWKMYGGGEGADTSEDMKFAMLRTQASRMLGDPMDYLGNTLEALLLNNAILPLDRQGYMLDPDTGQRIVDSQGEYVYYRDVNTTPKGYILDPHTNKPILSQSGDPIWYQSEILPDRVLVYTPDGDLKSLPQGATPLDFAYYIHEDVGNTCVGARVNSKMQKLDYTLQMGDRVEVITRQNARPSLDWLYNGYSRTRRAHEKIKRFFREKDDETIPEVETLGRTIIKKRLSAHKIRDLTLAALAKRLHQPSERDLLEAIGSGEISVQTLDDNLGTYILEQLETQDRIAATHSADVSFKDFDLLYTQAQCCLPLPGDDTVSYITQGRGFTLHRADCRNVKALDPARISYFDWPEEMLCVPEDRKPPAMFHTRLTLLVVHPTKTILYIKDMASHEDLIIESVRMYRPEDLGTQVEIMFRVACREHIEKLARKLNASDDILMIRRPTG